MIVFLFDIDGTLLLTGGAGRIAMQDAMREIYQLENLAQIEVQGRTDYAIIRDLFQAHEIEHSQQSHAEFCRCYHEVLRHSITISPGRLMPGVSELLNRLEAMQDVELGLLTGNSQAAASIKLTHFQLNHYFQFGGFGDWLADRNEVAQAAYDRCTEHLRQRVPMRDVWVIGDTVHDIRCARSIGANVIAVTTGNVPRHHLERERPDLLLDDLSEPSSVMQVLC